MRFKKKHHFIDSKSGLQAERIPSPKEYTVHVSIAEFLDWVLIPGRSKYTSHDASIGLGIYRILPKDSSISRQCKNFYNRFVIAAQRKFIAKGIKKDWPDLLIHYEGGKSLWFEIKREGEKPRPDQRKLHEELEALGIPVEVPKSIDDARKFLAKYNIPTRETLTECPPAYAWGVPPKTTVKVKDGV